MTRPRDCGFDKSKNDRFFDCPSCPAERVVQVCNLIQVRFMGKGHEDICQHFEDELQSGLENIGYNNFVFWTPDREKPGENSISLARVHRSSWYDKTEFERSANDALLDLNKMYRSHDFLRKLLTISNSAKSRVFCVNYLDRKIHFHALFPDIPGSNIHTNSNGVHLTIEHPETESPSQVIDRLRKNKTQKQLISTALSLYIESCTSTDIVPVVRQIVTDEGRIHSVSDDDLIELGTLWTLALRQITLMVLFMELNNFSRATYYLSPLDRDTLKSSMVIYWNKNWPNQYCHYLIQMLLGLNTALVLRQVEEINVREKILEARKIALGHYGHTLKGRLDVLSNFIDEYGTPYIRVYKELLSDLSLIIMLNTLESRRELECYVPDPKKERFLAIESDNGVEEYLDIALKIREWSTLFIGQRTIKSGDHNHNPQAMEAFELMIVGSVKQANIGFTLTAKKGNETQRARMAIPVYRGLILELLDNAMHYGMDEQIMQGSGEIVNVVRVELSKCVINFGTNNFDVLVLSNMFNPNKIQTDRFLQDSLQEKMWKRWPEHQNFNGPTMSIEFFRRFSLGDIFYRVESVHNGFVFHVGLCFEGMNIIM